MSDEIRFSDFKLSIPFSFDRSSFDAWALDPQRAPRYDVTFTSRKIRFLWLARRPRGRRLLGAEVRETRVIMHGVLISPPQ
jgi:hypothetical protein